ncbi:MFS transporter [Actinoplanes sp. NPDC051851]|uniref:MFS transporter n=1 Tax=Actinoplanes sp. NPDC051851 TaxID=3154753 RepID=UPI0034331D8F
MTVTLRPRTEPDRSELRRGRIAACTMFVLGGAVTGIWTARIPAIKHDLRLGDAELSVALLVLAAGGLIGMLLVGRLVDRYGSTTVMTPAALAVGPLLILPAYASNLLTLTLALGVLGAAHGTLNVAMNANAVRVERAHHRSIMSGIHAGFSIGGFLGAAVGGMFAAADLSPAATFICAGTLIAGLAMWASRWALPDPHENADHETTNHARGGRRPAEPLSSPHRKALLLLGLLAFATLVSEGAVADWSSVYLHDSLGSSAGVAAAAYAAFALMMTAGRLAGNRLVAALGPARLVRGCGFLAATGFGAALLIGRPAAAIIGFAALGAGLSCIVPQVYSAAGNVDPAQPGRGLARAASLGYLGFLTGPVIIGGAASLVDLPRAMLILPLLAAFVAAASTAVRTPGPGSRTRTGNEAVAVPAPVNANGYER